MVVKLRSLVDNLVWMIIVRYPPVGRKWGTLESK